MNMVQLDAVYKTHFKYNDRGTSKAKGWKKLYPANINQKKVLQEGGPLPGPESGLLSNTQK